MRVHYDGPSGSWDTTWPEGTQTGDRVFVEQRGVTLEYKLAGIQDGIAFYIEQGTPQGLPHVSWVSPQPR